MPLQKTEVDELARLLDEASADREEVITNLRMVGADAQAVKLDQLLENASHIVETLRDAIPIETILDEVADECVRQVLKFGVQNHPSFVVGGFDTPIQVAERYYMPNVRTAQWHLETHKNAGQLAWMDILGEEVAEVVDAFSDLRRVREELLQVAAVCVSWVESIDRNRR